MQIHKKIPKYLRSPRTNIILAVFVSLLFLGSTIYLINQNQDNRSKAAYFTTCAAYTPEQFAVSTDIQSVLLELINRTRTVQSVAIDTGTTPPGEFKTSLQKRKEALVQSMRTDPRSAWAQLLSGAERTQIRELSDNCVEEEVSVEGVLDAYVIDYENDTSETVYELKTAANKKYRVHPTKDHGFQSNSRVRLRGFQIDQEILFDTANAENFQINGQSSTGQISTQTISHAQGSQKLAVILAKFQSSPASPLSASQLNTVVFSNINNYYQEVSYDQVSLTGDVFGWYTIPNESGCTQQTINNVMSAAFNAANADLNFQDYDRFLVFAYDVTPLNCPFDGIGSVGKGNIQTPDGTKQASWSWSTIKQKSSTTALQTLIAGHELGHNFGVGHAKSISCGGAPLAASGCGVGSEYGDSFSIMGNDVAHMAAPHKEYIGWLPTSKIQTVSASGTYTIEPLATKNNGNGIKALKIPRGNGEYLYVENREKVGVDSNLGRNKATDVYDGALVHILPAAHETGLIDFSPPLVTPIENSPTLLPGNSFTDPASGTTLKVLSKSAGALNVEVLLSGSQSTVTPTGTQNSPTPTTTGTQQPTATIPPGSASLSVKAKLPGIGNKVGDNQSPARTTRNGTVVLTDLSGNTVEEKTAQFIYSSADYTYSTQVAISVPPGQYFVKFRLDTTLYKQSGQVITISSGATELSAAELVVGDLDQNNEVNMQDYSIFVSCFGNRQCSQKESVDFNEDGKVDGKDYNILLRSFAIQQGD